MRTKIQWTEETWNPIRGCSRVSEGCRNCYAERMAARFWGPGQPYEGLTRATAAGARWTGEVRLVPAKLQEPLRRRKPTTWFVNSMSDLFHERVSEEYIAAVFGVMAASPKHTFQVLTKRPKRALEWFRWVSYPDGPAAGLWSGDRIFPLAYCAMAASRIVDRYNLSTRQAAEAASTWPLQNVHLGVSVEDQATADERIPALLDCPAAVRWVSYEPAIGTVSFAPWLARGLDWIVVGGETGPGARFCDVGWIRQAVQQCKATGVACFVKALGARPYVAPDYEGATGYELDLRDPKGADMDEWPEELRVRELP